MARIFRAHHAYRERHTPYHGLLPLLLLLAFVFPRSAFAETTKRQEAILIDASGSVRTGGPKDSLFRQYLQAAKHLLETEPPASRVVVSVIATDSFGSAPE